MRDSRLRGNVPLGLARQGRGRLLHLAKMLPARESSPVVEQLRRRLGLALAGKRPKPDAFPLPGKAPPRASAIRLECY